MAPGSRRVSMSIFLAWSGFGALNGSECSGGDLVMWSWGFTQRCCDVYPSYISHCGMYECGDGDNDPTYYRKRLGPLLDAKRFEKEKPADVHELQPPLTVYVASPNFQHFLSTFVKLPKSSRIVLVTGLEDVGVPSELCGFGRSEFAGKFVSKDNPLYKQSNKLSRLISDPRLAMWYTQNYDLLGCNAHYCSNLTSAQSEVARKVMPLPIGVDFHTKLKKKGFKRDMLKNTGEICNQQNDMYSLRDKLPSFSKRAVRVLGAFACDTGNHPRKQLCKLINKHMNPNPTISSSPSSSSSSQQQQQKAVVTMITGGREDFWKRLGDYAFSFAPPGHGTDTHRLWEILVLGSVPITLSSQLDKLYCHYPVIVVKSWESLFTPGAGTATVVPAGASGANAAEHFSSMLVKFKEHIQDRFGDEPFSANVTRMLTINYWKEVVKNQVLHHTCPEKFVVF